MVSAPEVDAARVNSVAQRIAARGVARRASAYTEEIGRLIDAGRTVMARSGMASRPRVADIVAEAGLSNDAFYRHFRSKDELVAAILEEGTERLRSYLSHQMAKADTPRDRVVVWVEGILSQADSESSATTRAVLWNMGGMNQVIMASPPSVNARLAELLWDPYRDLGSTDPAFDARLAANVTVGELSNHLWRHVEPAAEDVARIADACLRLLL